MRPQPQRFGGSNNFMADDFEEYKDYEEVSLQSNPRPQNSVLGGYSYLPGNN